MNAIFHGKIFTIPNLLSFLRLVMIPWFVWEYLDQENSIGTALILLLSGFTDTIDGMIARRFNMVSNLGKALDPVADKLTHRYDRLPGHSLSAYVGGFGRLGSQGVVCADHESSVHPQNQ